MNSNGILPHPMITRWLKEGIKRAVHEITEGKETMRLAMRAKGFSQKP